MLGRKERARFDALFEAVLEAMPAAVHALLEEAPVVLDDAPSAKLARELGLDRDEEALCGLHSGIPLTERSVNDSGQLPDVIHLFREGIIDHAGGWDEGEDEDGPYGGEARIREEIRITLLHELGHHFGLDEEDLERLGYA